MNKLKQFASYLIGYDIYEDRKDYEKRMASQNSLTHLSGSTISTLDPIYYAVRYISGFLEMTAIMDLCNGQYAAGLSQIIVAECIRLAEHEAYKNKQKSMEADINKSPMIIKGLMSPIQVR